MILQPLITFVLVAYKQERFIREAIEGAFSQTYEPLEIILSDDCSPDGTFDIMKEMAASYLGPHRIRLNRNAANLGLAMHINVTARLASGDWLVMAAGDDISNSGRCLSISEAVSRWPDAVAVCSSWNSIDAVGLPLFRKMPRHFEQERHAAFGDWSWIKGFQKPETIGIPGCTAAWHRSLFDAFPPLEKNVIAEDVVLGYRAYLTGGVVYLPDVLVHYRAHEANLSGAIVKVMNDEIERTTRFSSRMASTYAQCVSEVNGMRNRLPPSRYRAILSLLSFGARETKLTALWWSLSWWRRVYGFLGLLREPYRVNFRVWLPRLLPRWCYQRLPVSRKEVS
jgi:glycosyltransferase involved in cell wall biosynthesis